MSKAEKAVNNIVNKWDGLQLPATSKFLAAGALDEEEKAGKAGVNLLSFSGPKKRQKKKGNGAQGDEAQGDWSALDSSLTRDDAALSALRAAATSKAVPLESDWHEIPVARMTPELQKDLRIIENRQHLDPKRFYKSSGSGRRKGELPARVQVGTVVVGAHEFYSSRLTKKERRRSIMDEVMTDERVMAYTKSKFKNLQVAKQINKRVIDPVAHRKRRS